MAKYRGGVHVLVRYKKNIEVEAANEEEARKLAREEAYCPDYNYWEMFGETIESVWVGEVKKEAPTRD